VPHDDIFSTTPEEGRTVLKPTPGGTRLSPPPSKPAPEPIQPPPRPPGPAPVDLSAGFRAGLNPLEKAAASLLALVSRLRNAPSHPDPAGLRNQIIEETKAFEARSRAQGVKPETVLSARYVLCTVLDEAVLSTPWGNNSVWRTHSLLSTLHNDTRGGERFFALLKQAAQEPAGNLPLLELMYVCLALGFEGRYRVIERGREQLEELRERLYQMIRAQRGEIEPELSPHWQGIVDRRNPLLRYVPLWVVGAIAAVLLLALYVGLSFSLNGASDPVFAQVHGLKAPPQPARATPAVAVQPPAPPPPGEPAKPRKSLRTFLEPEVRQHLVDVREGPDRTVVTIRGDGLFPSGTSQVSSQFLELFVRIGDALETVPGQVLVTGHTDNVPIRSVRFRSNWHLSQARASSIRDLLGARLGSPGRVTAEGRADTEPLVPNDTPENRARNRRVEITLFGPPG